MKSHQPKSPTDSYESSLYLLWLFLQLLLELHSVIFQTLDSNESVSKAEEKNRNHRARDGSELGLDIVKRGQLLTLTRPLTRDALVTEGAFNEDVRPTVT